METEVINSQLAEFEALPEGTLAQLINGIIVMSPAPNLYHQNIVFKLASFINSISEKFKYGAVFISPIDVYFSEEDVYQPDIVFVSNENKKILQDKIRGVPDLIVEVLSPSNAYIDLTHKKNIYEQFGVKEYWIVDREEKTIEINENKDSIFYLYSKAKKSGKVQSKLLSELFIDIDEIFVSNF